MRRRTSGLLLPGVLLTVLASVGVGALLSAGVPVIPDGLPVLPRSEREPERRGVAVSPTQSPQPETVPPATVAPTSTATTDRVRPTSGPVRTTPPAPPRTTPPTTAPPTKRPVPPPSCRGGSTTVYAVADASVDQSAPGETFGGPNLLVASRDKERNKRALLRFAVPAVPKGCSLQAATLTVTAKDVTGRRLRVARASGAWSESRVTWATAPKPYGASAAATVSSPRVVWDVTAQVAAGAAHGFVVYDAAEDSRGSGEQTNLNGRESRYRPSLTVRWG
jgi:hypothetical protein